MVPFKVVKRDGTIEDFIPSKLNKWAKWGSNKDDSNLWSEVVMDTVRSINESNTQGLISSKELQSKLIETCNYKKKWKTALMAGRLEAASFRKTIFPKGLPTVKDQFKNMYTRGYMIDLGYTDEEYEVIEKLIDHSRDYDLSYHQFVQIVKKYGLRDSVTGEIFETPQFTFMRMALALSKDEAKESRLIHVEKYYNNLSLFRINAPTPNYIHLGTKHNGLSSCCLYTAGDNAESLAIGDHIAYTMTYMSAGIGSYINTRSMGDPVRNGTIAHQGKLPYFRSLAGAIKANIQGGRGGACTSYFTCYDPEVMSIIMLQNPKTPIHRQNRNLHFAMIYNKFLVKKAARNENIFLFNTYTAPDLHAAIFNPDTTVFEELYAKYLNDDTFKKMFISARELVVSADRQAHEVATFYLFDATEVNRHTSFKETIWSSNLCLEITQPTSPYFSMMDLYHESEIESGEISTCSLAGVVPSNVPDDESAEEAAFYALRMIDACIHMNTYKFPHLKHTALSRLNAGVGIVGLAHVLAERGVTYNSPEGLQAIHEISERHMYFLIKASLKLAKEFGVPSWSHKTKWADGWLPIDTYNKKVDTVVEHKLKYDWESLRKEIVENGGIRNSSLVAHMPTESSSKATGLPNGVYPIRDLSLNKTDAKNLLEWCAKDNDIYEDTYQIAWDLNFEDMTKVYSVIQKFTDQSISADFYRDRRTNTLLTSTELLNEIILMATYGVKTRYYTNTYTLEADKLETHGIDESLDYLINQQEENAEDDVCPGGSCKL